MCTGEVDTKVWTRPRLGGAHRFGGPVDVVRGRPGKAGHDRALRSPSDLGDRFEIAVRCGRVAGLDHVDAHRVEKVRDLELLLEGHGGAGALLAVAKRRVEDDDAFGRAGRRFG